MVKVVKIDVIKFTLKLKAAKNWLISSKKLKMSINNKRFIIGFSSTITILFLVIIVSCNGQQKKHSDSVNKKTAKISSKDSLLKQTKSTKNKYQSPFLQSEINLPISEFVRRIFQDKSGNLWFGTNGDGVARYNGSTLDYFSIDEGFVGVAVRGIIEDNDGNIWFGTERGITKFNGGSFINFTEKDGLNNNNVWSLFMDSKGIIWIGTLEGINLFDGQKFTSFTLPESKPDYNRGVTSAKIVHSIMEDSKNTMWFGTNEGAYYYDGKSLFNLSETDGLCNNAINDILEDKNGNIWFATHYGGVCHWDGKSFTKIATKERKNSTEVWSLFEDKAGRIWFPIESFGVYRYNGTIATNYNEKDGLKSGAIQCIFEDNEGRIWLGGYMGLFRFDGTSFYSVSQNKILKH